MHDHNFNRSQSEGYLTNLMARLFARALQSKIKPLGISTGTFPVLLALWEKDGQSQRELVEDLGVEQATMANTLGRMVRDGLVTRRAHEADGRVQLIWLTERAHALKTPALQAAQEVNESAVTGLTPSERNAFHRAMVQVIGNLST